MAKRQASEALLPQWTKYVVTHLGGKDPLGLSRVSQSWTDHLMPGIVVNTNRARYYSLYCWMLWHIEREEQPKAREDFVEAFQRREASVAFATLIHDPDSSAVGVKLVRRRLAEAGAKGELKTAIRVLPSEPLGGFGQYYGGSLYELGLTHRTDDGHDRITPGFAEDLAERVQASLGSTQYMKTRAFERDGVPRRVLESSSEKLTIDAITENFTRSERQKLIDLFFGFDGPSIGQGSLQRRFTLGHVLDLLDVYERAGIAVDEDFLDDQLVYAPTYFEVLVTPKGVRRKLDAATVFAATRLGWRQFCLHTYLTHALEHLLSAVLDLLSQTTIGRTLDEIVEAFVDMRFLSRLEDAVEGPSRTPRELMARLELSQPPDDSACMAARRRWRIDHVLSEESIWNATGKSPSETCALACLMLAVLYAKWRGVSTDAAWRETAIFSNQDLSAPNVLPVLDTWFQPARSWHDVIRFLIDRFVISQHDVVMYGKGRLDSSWIRREDDRYLKDQDYEPFTRSSRHQPAMRILRDLLLVKRDSDGCLTLTGQGRTVLRRVLAEAP